MNEPSEPHDEIVCPGKHQVRAAVDIFVPVAKRFTLNYHGGEEPSGVEYSITLEASDDPNEPWLPLRLTIGSADSTDLLERCLGVVKAGYIAAKGELVFDRQESVEQCIHLMDVHWFEAVEVTGAG